MQSVALALTTVPAVHPFGNNHRLRRKPPSIEAERLRALAAYHVLDTPPEMAFDRLARAAADICGTSMALVSLVDEHRQWFKANVGIPEMAETDRKIAFCSVAIEQFEPLEVPDASSDSRFAENPLVTGDLGLRFYAGAPLVTPGGHRIGTLCVLDRKVRSQGLSDKQRRLLVALAAQVVTELELRSTLRLMEGQQSRLVEREQRLSNLQKRVTKALDSSGVSVWEWDAATRRVWLGESEIDGPVPSTRSEDVLRTIHRDDRDAMLAHFRDYIMGQTSTYECEMRVETPGGGWRWMMMRGVSIVRDAAGSALSISGTLTDIDQRKCAEDRLQWLVNHDALTGLRNRLHFQQRLQAEVAIAAMSDGLAPIRIALVLLDLDHFKAINDVYGHGVGDTLLRNVAKRLAAFTGDGEVAARLGGDEFTLLLPNCGTDAAIAARVDQLVTLLHEPFAINGNILSTGASIGVSCYPDHGTDAASLLKNADIAMYRSKDQGRGIATFYRRDFSAGLVQRNHVFDSVRRAIADGRVRAHYQAQFSLETRSVVGFEALVRIRDENGDYGLPDGMDEAFQDAELGVEIGNWMLRQVVADLAAWQRAGIDVGHIALNATAPELRRSDYGPKFLSALAAAHVSTARLHLEITEGVLLEQNSEQVADTLDMLSKAGVRIAFDDFGTGFAALSHLKRFPIDIIKIDRSFIREITTNGEDAAIVDAVIGLAKGLGMDVIAEGVETAEQVSLLAAKRCGFVQGFYFHRPTMVAGVEDLLRADAVRSRLSRRVGADEPKSSGPDRCGDVGGAQPSRCFDANRWQLACIPLDGRR